MSAPATAVTTVSRPDSPRGKARLGPSAFERALRLKLRRDALGLSAEDVARALGIERDRYVYWERTWSDALAEEWGEPLAQVLQCEQGWLVFGLGDPPPSPPRRNDEARVPVDVEVPSADMRVVLGLRLRDRRAALRISPRELADRARIPLYLIRRAEKELPERPLPLAYARRWEAALGVPDGWIYNEQMGVPPPNGGLPAFTLPEGATVAMLVRHVTRWLCTTAESRLVGKTCDLEENGERNAAILAARYGVHGEDASILQAVGDRFALTRERVRQLQDKHLKRSAGACFPIEPLDRLVEAVTPRLPATVKDLDTEFRALLGEELSIAGADRFAREFFGRSILHIEGGMTSPVARRGPIAVKKASDDDARSRAVREAAMKMISTCGAANIFWVVGSLVTDSGKRAITVNEAKRLLPLVEGFSWLKERDGYFWFGPDPRNRVVDVATKVLAVAKQRIDVEDIQEAIARSRRVVTRDVAGARLNVELPLPILSALLSATPGIKTVQRNDYVLEDRPELAQVLSNTELAVHRVLAARGGVADRKYLLDKLVRKRGGMTNISFQVALDQSPILRRLDYGLYALRGWPLDKSATGRAIAAACRNRRGGNTAPPLVVERLSLARFTTRVTDYMLANGVFSVPVKAGAQCGEGGEYEAPGGKVVRLCGCIKDGYRMPGMVQVLKLLGAKAGDSASVALDNVAKTVQVELRATPAM